LAGRSRPERPIPAEWSIATGNPSTDLARRKGFINTHSASEPANRADMEYATWTAPGWFAASLSIDASARTACIASKDASACTA
jgi:hypothetical protein